MSDANSLARSAHAIIQPSSQLAPFIAAFLAQYNRTKELSTHQWYEGFLKSNIQEIVRLHLSQKCVDLGYTAFAEEPNSVERRQYDIAWDIMRHNKEYSGAKRVVGLCLLPEGKRIR